MLAPGWPVAATNPEWPRSATQRPGLAERELRLAISGRRQCRHHRRGRQLSYRPNHVTGGQAQEVRKGHDLECQTRNPIAASGLHLKIVVRAGFHEFQKIDQLRRIPAGNAFLANLCLRVVAIITSFDVNPLFPRNFVDKGLCS